jgi:phosphoglycerate dehydrogenase-like enzyme
MAHRVLITSPKFVPHEAFTRGFLAQNACSVIEHSGHQRRLDEAAVIDLIGAAEGYIVGPEKVTERIFAAAPHLKVLSTQGVGYDHIDVEAATRHGVMVCNCAGCNNHAVSELALGMMIGLARSLYAVDRAVRAGEWPATTGSELWGKTLGIVGLGRVGKSMALLGRGLGMRVLATDIAWDITFANEHQISFVPLHRLLAESDFVSLHCPLTPQTRGLINADTLRLMKPTAYLINTSRGPVVHEPSLVQALRERWVAGAGIDVFETEPRPNNPYVDFDNVLLTSHRAGNADEAIGRSIELALLNITNVLRGEEPISRVN